MAGRSAIEFRLDALERRIQRIESQLELGPAPRVPSPDEDTPQSMDVIERDVPVHRATHVAPTPSKTPVVDPLARERIARGRTEVETAPVTTSPAGTEPNGKLAPVEPRFDLDAFIQQWTEAGGLEGERRRAEAVAGQAAVEVPAAAPAAPSEG